MTVSKLCVKLIFQVLLLKLVTEPAPGRGQQVLTDLSQIVQFGKFYFLRKITIEWVLEVLECEFNWLVLLLSVFILSLQKP